MRIQQIITDRVVIRCYQASDAQLLKNAIDESLPELKLWMPWAIGEPQTLEQKQLLVNRFAEDFKNGVDYSFAILNLAQTELLGSTGLHTRLEPTAREIGYWIHSRHTGKGLATHVVQALTQVAFLHENIQRLEIRCHMQNMASQRVAIKAGFTPKNSIDNFNVYEWTAAAYRKFPPPSMPLVISQ
ncbi:MAG: GNAT family N-acetyltransferase [Chitinophagales bacterium]|nr:GNAT family N-acetyltransferase [Chitinophagales bacterium]